MKHKDVYAIAFIPAKTDSTRLKKKNLRVIAGKTLVEHTIEYALDSEYIHDIIVSTESKDIVELCKKYNNVKVYNRPEHLMKDAEVADVYVDIFQNQFKNYGEWRIPQMATHVIALQPDNPDRNHRIDTVIDYLPENHLPNESNPSISEARTYTRGNSPMSAVREFLKHNEDFEIDAEIDNKLLISVAPCGYLKRIK